MTRNFYVMPVYLVGEGTNVLRVAESSDFPDTHVVIKTTDKADEDWFGKIHLDMPVEFMRLLANTLLKVCDEVQESSNDLKRS